MLATKDYEPHCIIEPKGNQPPETFGIPQSPALIASRRRVVNNPGYISSGAPHPPPPGVSRTRRSPGLTSA